MAIVISAGVDRSHITARDKSWLSYKAGFCEDPALCGCAFFVVIDLRYYFCQLCDIYHRDLHDKAQALDKEEIVLYHRAIEYIRKNYWHEDLRIKTIAERLNVSVRRLFRAFEDKNTTVRGAIQIIRLHKARELLRRTDDSVESIAASMGFSSTKYFSKQFVQCFSLSPSKEREVHRAMKKKRKGKSYGD